MAREPINPSVAFFVQSEIINITVKTVSCNKLISVARKSELTDILTILKYMPLITQ